MSSLLKSAVLSAAILAAGAATANAGLIWSDGFELPETPGQLSGQGNWIQDRGTDSDITVVNNPAAAFQGSQFLQASYSTGDSPRVAQGGFQGTPVNNADTYVLSTAIRFTNPNHSGLVLYLNGNSGPAVAVNTFFNAAGELYKIVGNTYTDLNAAISPDTWYNVTYTVRPATLDYQFTVKKASDNSVVFDGALPYSSGTAITSWYTVAFTQDAGAGTTWQLDNMSFSEVPVPEPVSGSLLLVGGGLLALRRRRR